MNRFVADTVAIILRLEKRRMGSQSKAAFEDVEKEKALVYVPAIALAEILYLSERKKITTSLLDVRAYMRTYAQCQEYPLDFATIESAATIHNIPELHDRLIAGVAKALDIPLLTNDTVLTASKHIQVIW